MGQHTKFDIEEVLRRGVFVFFRLVDFGPNDSKILIDSLLDSLSIIYGCKVSKYKKKLLLTTLLK